LALTKTGFIFFRMATILKSLSDYDHTQVPSGKGKRIAVVVAEWNSEITYSLRDAAVDTLQKYGVSHTDIVVDYVPGAFELTLGCLYACERAFDSVIAIGCVIKGETPHFDYICQGVTTGITHLNIEFAMPVIFGGASQGQSGWKTWKQRRRGSNNRIKNDAFATKS
jgi:6,7-dimethyl-8-ribityllumazine synthase